MRSFGMIQIRISDPRSLGRIMVDQTNRDESLSRVDSSVHLVYHDPSDLGSLILIRIISKERTLRLFFFSTTEVIVCSKVINAFKR